MRRVDLAVMAAMGSELQGIDRRFPLLDQCGSKEDGWRIYDVDGARLWCACCGMKAPLADLQLAGLKRECKVESLLIVGCCGALEEEMSAQSPVLAEAFIPADASAPIPADPTLSDKFGALLPEAKRGSFATSGEVLETTEKKRALALTGGAIAVEMEGAIIAAIARKHAIGCASLRFVLDELEENLARQENDLTGSTCRLTRADVEKRLETISESIAQCLGKFFSDNFRASLDIE